jgi:Trypsin-co-occurring domain 2
MTQSQSTDAVPLADLIQALRAELQKAIDQAEGQPLQFSLGSIELELAVEVAHQVGADGGIKFWVFTAGASASRSASTTQTFRLTLQPKLRSGADPMVSGMRSTPAE